jgi:hypothetical protein
LLNYLASVCFKLSLGVFRQSLHYRRDGQEEAAAAA